MEENNLSTSSWTIKYKGNALGYLPLAFISVVAIAVFVRHLLVFDKGISFIVDRVTIDDTYYYLNIAWNQRHLGFTTFDGINQTNGVQFLWYWILVIFSHFFETRESFLFGSLIFCAVLSVLCIFLAYRLGQVLGLGWKSIIPAVAIAGISAYNKILIVGLENALHLNLILLLVIQYCRFLKSPGDMKYSSRYYLRITCLLGLITWTRLDNGPISAILFMHATFEFLLANRKHPRFYLSRIMFSSAIIGLSALILFYSFYLMGGSVVPVSGLWKQRPHGDANLVAVFIEAWQSAFQRVFPLEHVFNKRWSAVVSLVLPVVFVITLITRYRSALDIKKPMLRGLLILLLSITFHRMIMVYRLPPEAVGRGFWYLAPQFVMMAVIVSLLIQWLPEMFAFRKAGIQQKLGAIATLLFVINTLVFCVNSNNWYLKNTSYDKFHSQRMEAALWLKANFPGDVRFGALNSGELGFFSQRSVTNLDGLVNSYDYFKFRKNGGGITEFCTGQGIDYFIDYMIPEEVKKNSVLIHSFNSKPQIQLLKFVNTSRASE